MNLDPGWSRWNAQHGLLGEISRSIISRVPRNTLKPLCFLFSNDAEAIKRITVFSLWKGRTRSIAAKIDNRSILYSCQRGRKKGWYHDSSHGRGTELCYQSYTGQKRRVDRWLVAWKIRGFRRDSQIWIKTNVCEVLRDFKNRTDVLVAAQTLRHVKQHPVYNYDIHKIRNVHRIGRTGRAGENRAIHYLCFAKWNGLFANHWELD